MRFGWMSRGMRVAAVAVVPAVVMAGPTATAGAAASPQAAAVSGVWGTARELPGLASLGKIGGAAIQSLSCGAAGDCAAGGDYWTGGGENTVTAAFVADEDKGTWDNPEPLAGLAALNTDGDAVVRFISCPSAGNCTAVGTYSGTPAAGAASDVQVFVADEKGGAWGAAVAAPGLAGLNAGGYATVNGVSCPSAGNCVVAGDYTDAAGNYQPYLLTEADGTWQDAAVIPGAAALNDGAGATAASVSCASAGNCAVGGSYWTSTADTLEEAFAASETNGTWNNAVEVPGTSGSKDGAAVDAVSCPSAGNCVAVGSDGSAFAVTDVNGTWGKPVTIAGISGIGFLSCPADGSCAAGGIISLGKVVGDDKAAVVTETDGTWGKGIIVPGLTSLPGQQDSDITSVSCATAGNCTAGGYYQYPYLTPDGGSEAFTVAEVNGVWTPLKLIPGLSALTTDKFNEIAAVSCTAPATCAAAGEYAGKPGLLPFVASETPALATTTTLSLSAAKITYGHEQSEHLSVKVTAKSGTPAGKVTVRAGSVTVCVITLKSGKGSCTLTAKQLKAGTYHLAASYPGVADFAKSASAAKTLTVAK